MGVNKASDRYLIVPEGAVMTSGMSAQLAKEQIGLFNMNDIGSKGAKAIATTNGLDKKFDKLEVRLGVDETLARTLSNKAAKTLTFSLSDVSKAWIGNPSVKEQKFDEWYIGYDGFDDSKSFEFLPGDNFQVDLVLWGKPIGYLNMAKSDTFIAKYALTIPNADRPCEGEADNCTPVSCKEYTLAMAEYFNNFTLPSGDTLSKYFFISPVLNTTADVAENYTLYSLSYCGSDQGTELGKVQAQYPNAKVTVNGLTRDFEMLVLTSSGAPAAYTTSLANMFPDCEGNCPSSYSLEDGGFVYIVKAEETAGADSTGVITTAIGAKLVVGSVKKLGYEYGVGYYMILTNSKIGQTEKTAIIALNGTISYGGEKDAVCTSSAQLTFNWAEVATATAIEKTYEIILQDDCGGNMLTELQQAYPEMNIELGTPTGANCITRYTGTVLSDVQFPLGCPGGTVIQEMYSFKAPAPFDVNAHWIEVPENDETEYKCGLHIKAKPVIVNAVGECLIDEIPFIATSMRVKPAGNYITNTWLNFNVSDKPFATTQVDRAVDLDNLGGNMRSFERQGRFYFQNESCFKDTYAKAMLGLNTQLEGLTQYSTYAFQINRAKHAQGFGQTVTESINYHMIAPTNRSSDVEGLLKTIAGGAGVVVEVI